MHRIGLIALTIVLYAAVVATTAWGLVAARRWAVASYDDAEQAHWEEFRDEMDARHIEREALREEIARESGQPITPKPPKTLSQRPPALELLANHFAACMTVALLATSGLFAVLWGLVVGAVLRPGRDIASDDDEAAPANIRPDDGR